VSDKPKVGEIPGSYSGGLSLQPLMQAKSFIGGTTAYTAKRAHGAGCPVFKCHPGVKSVLVSDHAAMSEVFTASPDVWDREESVGFGCVALFNDQVLDGAVPALVSHRGNHAAARGIVDAAMKHRGRDVFNAACQAVWDGGWPSLAGLDSANFEEAVVEAASSIAYRWFFDMQGPPGKAHLAWLRGSFGLKTDTALTNFIAGLAMRPPSTAVRAYAQEWMGRVRSSSPYAGYQALAADVGLPADDVAPHLMFAAGCNATGGTYTTAFPTLGQLHAAPALRQKVADELAGFEGDADALDQLPYLDALLHEAMRMFGRPRQYYRRAMIDTTLPLTDGREVDIPAHTRVGVVAVSARQDPTIFEDPTAFHPDRYIDQPQLKEQTFIFGPPAGSASPYGCAGGANGTAAKLWKTVVASLARDTDWRLDPPPVVNIDAPTGLDPNSLMWHRR
jgi:cytochrome P450